MSRQTTDDYKTIDVRWLRRNGYLTPGNRGRMTWTRGAEYLGSITIECTGAGAVVLAYRCGMGREYEYLVRTAWTPCHFGGERPWFICPAKGCARRCAILYGGEYFVCRECRNLTYRRCNLSGDAWGIARHRLQAHADKIGLRLRSGSNPPIMPPKPKYMHWRTYSRWLTEWRRLLRAELAEWPAPGF